VNPDVVRLEVFRFVVPEMILGVAACVLFLGATFRANRHLWASVALIALALASAFLYYGPVNQPSGDAVYISSVVLDPLAMFTKAVALVSGAVLLLLSWNDVPDRQAAEYHACLLLITAGVCLTGMANDLITLFLALELVSIPTYVLLYLPRHDQAAQEAAMKYFLLSVFSSAMLLFGFSYLYGLGATTSLPLVLQTLAGPGPVGMTALVPAALVMVVAGLGFKITAVPFHFYAPDVYQGAPTAAAALLAFMPKLAGFVALVRVLGLVPPGQGESGLALGAQVPMLLYILAAVSMSLGNLLALLQDNLKRLLAYSSVAHAGYMLIGLTVAPNLHNEQVSGGVDAVLFYLVAYGGMTVGAFAILAYLNTPEPVVENVDDLSGLSRSHPGVALLLGLFLFSLIGIPLTAGFVGKLTLFFGALAVPAGNEHLYQILALVGALNAAVGAWYYLRILAVMYLRDPARPLLQPRSWPGLAALWLCAAVTLWFGIYPRPLLDAARKATGAQIEERTAGPSGLSSNTNPQPERGQTLVRTAGW
jgi:NADH-quinone oxidoreductase subunit N